MRDPAVHRQVIDRVVQAYAAAGFACRGWRESPIKGATSGNTEFISYFVRGEPPPAGSAGGGEAGAAAEAATEAVGSAAADPSVGSLHISDT